jgi:hypothetical protein
MPRLVARTTKTVTPVGPRMDWISGKRAGLCFEGDFWFLYNCRSVGIWGFDTRFLFSFTISFLQVPQIWFPLGQLLCYDSNDLVGSCSESTTRRTDPELIGRDQEDVSYKKN